MGGVDLVLFDIDGTLLNSGGGGRAAMIAAASELFGCPQLFDNLSFAGAVDSGIVAHALACAGIPPTPRRMGRMRATYARRLTRDLFANPGAKMYKHRLTSPRKRHIGANIFQHSSQNPP